jgi:uncharacterized protein (TIGR02453 family)
MFDITAKGGTPMSDTRYFTPAVFSFLRELAENNARPWWEDNKERYIATIREPAFDFIADFGDRLAGISPHFTADTRANGGSLMRPYRDMRFSSDKTPYKTNVGIQFRHVKGKNVHAPGYYLHLEPGQCFTGVGMWHPESKVAQTIRRAINDDPDGWAEAAHSRRFAEVWSIGGRDDDRLKRLPKDLDTDHPYRDDLRLRSFIAGRRLTHRMVTSTGFADHLYDLFARATAFNRFLCEAIGVPF